MRYISTRDREKRVSAAEAIVEGLSKEGGLYAPESVPKLRIEEICRLGERTYPERAAELMSLYLEGYGEAELLGYARSGYSEEGYDTAEIAPLRELDRETHILELWHGPTSAFKDMALQMLPRLMRAAMEKTGEKREVCILTATSGDTGKAALEGFKDVAGTRILVFYPKDGVSEMQKLQMTTQEGGNVGVYAVEGDFDDTQNGVKAIFSDTELRGWLAERGYILSSANSINWGRLLPQIVYYVSAYSELVKKGAIVAGEQINYCVPTGNFGNILAGYYAREMGVPIGKLICASNANKVLTEFIESGRYDRKRELVTTISPSMDILVSSNLERLLFILTGQDSKEVSGYMERLAKEGSYEISVELQERIREVIVGGYSEDEATKREIGRLYREHGYLADTHTAVGSDVLRKYRERTGDMRKAVIVSTASPYKFADSVLEALGESVEGGVFERMERLRERTGSVIPKRLSGIREKQERFNEAVSKEGMAEVVKGMLDR